MKEKSQKSYGLIPIMKPRPPDEQIPRIQSLWQAGHPIIEVPLRHPKSLDWLTEITQELPKVEFWAGTVIDHNDVPRLAKVGCKTIVSPGFDSEIVETSLDHGLRPLPGVATATEIIQAKRYSIDLLKLFPAVPLGGIDYVSSMAGPFENIRFIATGGITRFNYRDYLELPNIAGVAASFLDP